MGPWTFPWMTVSLSLDSHVVGLLDRSNERTNEPNSQAGADRWQLPASTQIGDGILRHALQNRCTSFCGYECCPWDRGWQALPCRVRQIPRLQSAVPVSPRLSPPITFTFCSTISTHPSTRPTFSRSIQYRFGGDSTNVYTL